MRKRASSVLFIDRFFFGERSYIERSPKSVKARPFPIGSTPFCNSSISVEKRNEEEASRLTSVLSDLLAMSRELEAEIKERLEASEYEI